MQVLLADRPGQADAAAHLGQVVAIRLVRDQHEAGLQRAVRGDARLERHALEPPHRGVDEGDRDGALLPGRLTKDLERRGRRGRRLDGHAPARQVVRDDRAVCGVVVDDQGANSHQGRVEWLLPRDRHVDCPGPDRERERASRTELAGDGDLTAHQGDQLAADGKPQPCAAELPGGGGVCLGERLEDHRELVGGDADPGVGELEVHDDVVAVDRGGSHAEHDLPDLGELDGVADQVGQHLTQTARVTTHRGGDRVVEGRHQVQSLGLRGRDQEIHDVVDQGLDAELDVLDLQLALLDLGEVEDAVDDGHQRLARPAEGLGELALLSVELGVEQELGEPDDAVHRRPDLVAHVRQEVRLEPRGGGRLVTSLGHGCLGPDLGRDVGEGPDPARDLSVLVEQGLGVQHQDPGGPARDLHLES